MTSMATHSALSCQQVKIWRSLTIKQQSSVLQTFSPSLEEEHETLFIPASLLREWILALSSCSLEKVNAVTAVILQTIGEQITHCKAHTFKNAGAVFAEQVLLPLPSSLPFPG